MSRKLRQSSRDLILLGLAMGALCVAFALVASRAYFIVDPPRFLVLHTLLELASILVSFAVFIVTWEAYKQNRNSQGLFVATGFLTVAAVDTMHTLSSNGMPDFLTPNGVDKTLYYWIYARMWAALVLWIAALVRPRSSGWYLSRPFLVALNLVACATPLVAVTLFQEQLPLLYLEGQGLTPLKLALEYSVIGVSLLAMVGHARLYRSSKDEAVALLVAALLVSVFSEVAFTLYLSPYDSYTLIGHWLKVLAHYLIFRALVVSSVHRPYAQLRVANEQLERTVAALDRRNQELDALDDVALALSASLKPNEVLGSAIEKAMNVMQAGAGAIFLLREGTGHSVLAEWRGLTAEMVAQCAAHPLRLPYIPLPSAGNASRAMVLEDPAQMRSLGGALARIAPFRACICAPILSRGKQLGAIAMVGTEGRTFSPRDADLLTAVGYQLGLAIENARLYEQTDEKLREKVAELQAAERRARFLAEAGALVGSSMDLGKVLDLLARKCAEVVGDWCSVHLLDETGQTLRLEAIHHPDEDELAGVRQIVGRNPLPLNENIFGRVVQTGEPMLLPAIAPDDFASWVQQMAHSVDEIAMLRRLMPISCIVAPLRAHGRTAGVLMVASTHSQDPFTEADLLLVTELADRAAVAIENSQLFQETLAQRRHLEAIISQMADGLVIADEAGHVLVANTSALMMLGDRMDRLVGGGGTRQEAEAADSGATPTGAPTLMARALAGELLVGEELALDGSSGERVLSASASPVRDESGSITGAVVVLRDVTAERAVERMKDEFMATVSHELRTPITAVLGYADILLRGLRGPLAPKQTEAVGAVRAAAQRLLALINDLLDMSRLEAGAQELNVEPVLLLAAAQRALSTVAVLAASKGISLVPRIPEGLPPVLADEEQLQRALGNLLSNAIKFTPEGGTVILSAEPEPREGGRQPHGARLGGRWGGFVAVMVSDTGIGIPAEQQDKIWEKFQQVDSSSRRLFGGTGLGLAITKRIVELHGGRVWVESEGVPGKGSTFGFTLPVANSE